MYLDFKPCYDKAAYLKAKEKGRAESPAILTASQQKTKMGSDNEFPPGKELLERPLKVLYSPKESEFPPEQPEYIGQQPTLEANVTEL